MVPDKTGDHSDNIGQHSIGFIQQPALNCGKVSVICNIYCNCRKVDQKEQEDNNSQIPFVINKSERKIIEEQNGYVNNKQGGEVKPHAGTKTHGNTGSRFILKIAVIRNQKTCSQR